MGLPNTTSTEGLPTELEKKVGNMASRLDLAQGCMGKLVILFFEFILSKKKNGFSLAKPADVTTIGAKLNSLQISQ